MVKKIHQQTFRELGSKSESLLSTFYHEVGDRADAAYFAPYLKSQRRVLGLSEAIIELATLEWTVFNVESQVGAWKYGAPENILTLNPSLNLLQLQHDVWSVYKKEKALTQIESDRMAHVLAIYLQPQERLASFCKIMPEWALVIDVLSEGSYLREDLLKIISKKYKVLFPKNQLNEILHHLSQIKIIESPSL